MATPVTGEMYYKLGVQLLEIKRQLRQPDGYPFDPDKLKIALQNAIDGIFLTQKLLKVIRTVPLPGISTFVVAEKLRPGEIIDGIKVGWFDEHIKTHLLGQIEEPRPALEIHEHELLKGSRGLDIIVELGGEEKVEISFGQFWEFLKTADQSLWHIAHIKYFGPVRADWDDAGLCFAALPVDYRYAYRANRRFLSC